jgi:hypothetical protein
MIIRLIAPTSLLRGRFAWRRSPRFHDQEILSARRARWAGNRTSRGCCVVPRAGDGLLVLSSVHLHLGDDGGGDVADDVHIFMTALYTRRDDRGTLLGRCRTRGWRGGAVLILGACGGMLSYGRLRIPARSVGCLGWWLHVASRGYRVFSQLFAHVRENTRAPTSRGRR